MKKIVAMIALGAVIIGAAATNASAEEYEVKKGDNLWEIAETYNTTIEDLVDINELKTTVIQPKQRLIINETYRVEKGDTLIGIGNEFDVEVEEIKEWNDLQSDVVIIGQELEIHGANIVQEDHPAEDNLNSAKKPAAKAEKEEKQVETKSEQNPKGQTISVKATAYTAKCDGCSGVTSTGVNLNKNPNAKVIAVDPNVIPLGSEVYVDGYGYATAADIGGAINGNKIDIHVPTKDQAYSWGVRTVNVTIIN